MALWSQAATRDNQFVFTRKIAYLYDKEFFNSKPHNDKRLTNVFQLYSNNRPIATINLVKKSGTTCSLSGSYENVTYYYTLVMPKSISLI